METLLGRYKNLIVLAAVLFAQLIGLAVQVKRPTQDGETRLLRVWAIAAIAPFEKAVVHTQNFVQHKWTGYLWLRGVRKENAQLKSDIERMKLEQARMSEDANMARRIQALLAFKEQYIENTVAAQVIGTSASEQSRVLTIDKGSDAGVKADMAVITPTGIVGKIVQVSNTWAQVLPINDQLSGVGAALQDSRLQGILKGAPNGTTTLQYIMADEPVKPGETVITSGGDRIFPKGLEIGRVATVEQGKDLFLSIRVIPSARLDRLEEVLIITKIQDKLPDTKDLGPIRASDILSQRLPGVPTTQGVDAAGNAIQQAGTANPPAGSVAPKAGAPAARGASKPNAPTTTGARASTPASGTAAQNPAGGSAAKPSTMGTPLNPNAPATVTKPARKPPAATTANPDQSDSTQQPAIKPKPPEEPPQ